MSNFNTVPTIHGPRSKHDLSYEVKTSASVGTLYPIYCQEIYPGDTFKCDTSFVARLTSSYLRPVMDNLVVDFYYFFVPARLTFDKFAQIFGENAQNAWAQQEEVVAPTMERPIANTPIVIHSKSVADYLGLPVGEIPDGASIMPFRAFAKIYDDWFRDENLIDPMFINTGDYMQFETPNNGAWTPNNYTGMLPKVAKMHDVFTSALPNTQKSLEPAYVPLGGFVPMSVNPNGTVLRNLGGTIQVGTTLVSGQGIQLIGTGHASSGLKDIKGRADATSGGETYNIDSTNLGVNLSDVGVLTVPDMRYAFQLQRILERSARSGTRYSEYLLSAFGVQSPDARLQRSEYLGGKRVPLSAQQVAQTVRGNNDYDELGSLGAFSLTNGKCGYSKAFVEHGYVIGTMCIRINRHTYQQGIEKFWQRSDRFSYYDPALAHISEQPVYKSEIFAKGQLDRGLRGEIFGYQEAWYDLRNRMNIVTGEMRSDATNSLDIWHYADDYENTPYLNKGFIEETPTYVDRTIAVPSTSLDQFIFDIYHNQSAIRRIPAYSTPGLIDHY